MGTPTLQRFFVLHFMLPFLIVGGVMAHLVALHRRGSRNPLGIDRDVAAVPFHPYYTSKDFVGYVGVLLALRFVVFFWPDMFAEPENFTKANPLVTPAHIKPE